MSKNEKENDLMRIGTRIDKETYEKLTSKLGWRPIADFLREAVYEYVGEVSKAEE